MLITKEEIKKVFIENNFKFKNNSTELQPAIYKSINEIEKRIVKKLEIKGLLKEPGSIKITRIANKIRAILEIHKDGLTVAELTEITGLINNSIYLTIKSMPDVYIDRWAYKNNLLSAVWCLIPKPENCPKPKA